MALTGLLAEPTRASTAPLESFRGGKGVARVAREVQEARAKTVPALRLLPGGTVGVMAATGEYAPMVATALAAQLRLQAPNGSAAQSVESIAVSVGKGGDETCRDLVSLQGTVQQLAVIIHLKRLLSGSRGSSSQSKALMSLQDSYNTQMIELKDRLTKLHVTPMFIVLTAVPGKEHTFRRFAGQMWEKLTKKLSSQMPNTDRGVLELPMASFVDELAERLCFSAEEREALSIELSKRKLYILAEQRPDVLRIALVADQPVAPWPLDDSQSMLAAPELIGMDESVHNIQLTAWISAELQVAIYDPDNTFGVLPMLQELFCGLAKSKAGEALVFAEAAKGAQSLRNMAEREVKPQLPIMLQIWKEEQGTQVEFAADACGSFFKHGELRHTKLAGGSVAYMETTGFCSPSKTNYSAAPDALLNMLTGFYLTLDEELKDRTSMAMMFLQQFRPQIRAVWGDLSKITGSFSSPMTLLIDGGGRENAGAAIRFTVNNRSTLIEGWSDFTRQLKTIAEALAIPPGLLDHMPILSQPALNGATRYMLAFPVTSGDLEPQLVLDEHKLVLAVDCATADALSQEDTTGEPFCGAVFTLNVDELLRMGGVGSPVKEIGEPDRRIRGEATVKEGKLLVKMRVTDR